MRGRQVHRNGQVPGPSYRGAARRPQRPRTDPLDELQFLGHRNEYQWRNKYSVFRRQAYQCLEAGEAALRHFEKRLVVQFEAIMQHRVTNSRFQFGSRKQLGIHLGLEEPDAITPVGLGFVHCQIGAFQKPLRVVSVFRRQCNANAYCGDDRLPPELHWCRHSRGESPCQIIGLILAANPGLNDDELVATEPGYDIADAGYRAQAFGGRLEQKITAID